MADETNPEVPKPAAPAAAAPKPAPAAAAAAGAPAAKPAAPRPPAAPIPDLAGKTTNAASAGGRAAAALKDETLRPAVTNLSQQDKSLRVRQAAIEALKAMG